MVDSDSFPRTLDQTSALSDDQEGFCRYKFTAEEDDEFFRVSVRKEPASASSLMNAGDWIVSARLDCIRWIFNVGFLIHFCFSTCYFSLSGPYCIHNIKV